VVSPTPVAIAGLQSVTLRASRPEGVAVFAIRRAPGQVRAELVTQLPGREARQRVVPFAIATPTELLSEALQDMSRDLAYEDAQSMAALFSARREAEPA
jgi:hypothetical protein